MNSASSPKYRIVAAIFVLMATTSAWLAWAGLPIARGDDAFYKAPGAELAATGVFASPSITGYLPEVERVYAAYPPLYPWAFAAWLKLFGFSLLSATAFNHAIHLLGTAVLVWAASALLASLQLSSALKTAILAALAIIHFGDLRFFDRQEELALIFVWLELGFWIRFRSVKSSSPFAPRKDSSNNGATTLQTDEANDQHAKRLDEDLSRSERQRFFAERKAIVTGVCVGLAILVGPWPGTLAVGSVAQRMILEAAAEKRIPWLSWFIAAFVAALPLGMCLAWMEFKHPGLVALQFREHISRIPTVRGWEHPHVWARSWTYASYQLPFVLFGVMLLPRAFARPWTREKRAALATTVVCVAAILFAACWRADSYIYLWAALLLLFSFLAFAIGAAFEQMPSNGERRLLLFFLTAVTLVALRDPISLSINAAQIPAEDRPGAVFARLHEMIPPSDVVCVSPRYWHAFQNRNPWRQTAGLNFIPSDERKSWQWIVLPIGHGDDEFRRRLLEGFELVERRPANFTPFAPTFPPDERTWAYELYRRR